MKSGKRIMRHKWKIIFLLSVLSFLVLDNPEFFIQYSTKTNQRSQSIGSVSNGSLTNGIRLPYRGRNYKYFSKLSYYILNRAYANAKVYNTVIGAYKECEATCPHIFFRLMECSNKNGGRLFPHRTHQNGLSVDFMTPLIKNKKQYNTLDIIGIWRYLVNTNEHGQVTHHIKIDFDSVAKHILALDNAARQNGLRIKKVILKTNLKDELFKTQSGQALKQRGIYFVKHLSKTINDLHDDHYHIDFQEI
ncbi:hypothetical protein EYV94_21005 [Puteibacter caeruleilacunae]|nr:hypothetical protein EYV94_21005 [Puteibacter caeruleilacunae]